ncbi:MAG: right-handed parallel beta-helix repeat-containing protein [Myxococcales bacterium]|nr:right-handed parallel beta-helix repeat-containing protein [Myxococcales bacterium]
MRRPSSGLPSALRARAARRAAARAASLLVAALALASPASAQIACGDTLGPGGSFVLGGSLMCATASALTLVGPVKVDLGNHTLTCTSGGLTGLDLAGKGVSVRNGAIEGCDTGVAALGQGRHKIAELSIADADVAGVLVSSPGNRISGVDVVDSAGEGFSVVAGLEAADKQQLDRCTATNVGIGVNLDASTAGHRLRDIAIHTTSDSGLVVASNATRLERVNVSGTTLRGIDIPADDVRMKGAAVAETGSHGIAVDGARAQIQAAHVAAAAGRGFELGGADAKLKDVSARTSGSQGFLVFGARANLAKARAISNTGAGIALSGATDASIQQSTARANGGFDASDGAPGCGTNVWKKNSFGATNDACIQ